MGRTIGEYVCRPGPTGREGKNGAAISFLTDEDSYLFYDMKPMLLARSSSVCPSELANYSESKNKPDL